jgi:hypothetical protein
MYNYSKKSNILSLGINSENFIKIELTKALHTDTFNSCSNFSYTIRDKNEIYGNLFIEYISLEHSCVWNGLSTSFFESDFKHKQNLSSMEVVEEFDIKTYNFKTYLINKKSYMNLIYIYGVSKDILIVDYDGKLYDKVLKVFKPDYVNKYIQKERYNSSYNESLVQNNIFNEYFIREIESTDEL